MRSLAKNLTLLNDIIVTFKKVPDIIAISETKLNDNYVSNISIPGYSFLNTNSKTSAGGVGLYLADQLNFIRRHDLELPVEGVESCWIETTSKKEQNIIIGCVYRHPHSKLENFHEAMKERLQSLNNSRKQVIVLGDTNINSLQYCNDNRTADYLNMLLDSGFMPIITKATRITDHSKTSIDHIYTNIPQKVLKSGICLAGISDHLPVFCTIANKFPTTNESRYNRDFSNFNKDSFLKEISEIDFASLIVDDVNESMNAFAETFQKITDKYAPVRKLSNKMRAQLRKPWISSAILKSIKKRQKLFTTHFLSNDPNKVKEYKKYNNKLNKIKEAAKTNYFKTQFDMFSDNLKATWKLIGTIINRKKAQHGTLIQKLLYNGKCYNDKASICHQLNTHFINVGHDLAAQLPNYNISPTHFIHRRFQNSFMFRGIYNHEVQDALIGLKLNKSFIGTPPKCIKLACNFISEPLTRLLNLSLSQGIMPNLLKISKITPVDKGGETTDPTNFRPISTLSAFTQIFEKLVYKQLICYFEKLDILFEYQFGFRKGRSTSQAITEITDTLRKAIDNNLYTCGIFLDFSKAFDTVNHSILLQKLESYGIRGVPLAWFESYLTNRKQYVALGDTESSYQTVVCGVTQGSSLGPFLFLIYINDLPNCSEFLSFKIFADDTNLFASAKDIKSLELQMNLELKKVKEWCDINKLSINLKKTNYMIVKSPRKKNMNVNINITNRDGSCHSLERKDHIKYLGVMIDSALTWKYHISYVCSKLSRNTGVISKLRHYLPLKQLTQLYYNLIYPYISYAIVAWGSTSKTNLLKIQAKQNHIIRLMFFATLFGKNTDSALPLLNILEMLTVANVYRLHALKFIHAWHKGVLPEPFNHFFQYASNVHNYNTRYAAKQNLHKFRVKTNTGKQMISFMAIDLWQELPHKFKDLNQFAFSKSVKNYILSQQHQT